MPVEPESLADYFADQVKHEPAQQPIPIKRVAQRKIAVNIEGVIQAVEHWCVVKHLFHCPASGLFKRPENSPDGKEKANYSAEWVWGQMDVHGHFVDFEGLTQERFLAIIHEKYERIRDQVLAELRQKLAPPGRANMDQAVQLATMLIRYYCKQTDEEYGNLSEEAKDDVEDREKNSALLLVHSLWQVKRKIFRKKVKFPQMLTWWSREEGSGKSSFLELLYEPIEPFVDKSSFHIFSDKFGNGQFGQYYILVFPEMSGVASTNIGRLKEILDAESFSDRDMYTKTSMQAINRATCSNTSNYPPPHGLKIDNDGRRFASNHFSETRQNPDTIEKFLELIKGTALELWELIDVDSKPIIKDRFESIRAQQRADNRQENIIDEFLEVHCHKLDEPAIGNDATYLSEFTRRFREFIDPKRGFRDPITNPNMKKWLTACNVTVRRHSKAIDKQVVQSHKLNA